MSEVMPRPIEYDVRDVFLRELKGLHFYLDKPIERAADFSTEISTEKLLLIMDWAIKGLEYDLKEKNK